MIFAPGRRDQQKIAGGRGDGRSDPQQKPIRKAARIDFNETEEARRRNGRAQNNRESLE